MLIMSTLPIVIVVGLIIVSVIQFSTINNSITRIYDDNIEPMLWLKNINDSYNKITGAVNKADNGLVLPSEAYAEIRAAQALIEDSWSKYSANAVSFQEGDLAKEIKVLFRNADEGVVEVAEVLKNMGNELTWDEDGETPIADYNGDLYDLVDPISQKISELTQIQISAAEDERKKSESIFINTRNSYLIIAIVTVTLLSIAGIMVSRSIVSPLNKLRSSIEKAESERSLSVELDTSYDDEIGQVAQAYKGMMNRFSPILKNVRAAAQNLQANSLLLARNTDVAKVNVAEQLLDADMVAAATTQMTYSVEEVSQGAQQAAEAANKAKAASDKGVMILHNTTEAINRLSRSLRGVSEDINKVAEESKSIGSILDVIRGIADQTNLLALNAAIEAARAGEQGRGFAVVADEVRSLARRTQESTEEIQQMISNLQAGTKNAVDNMDSGIKDMENTLTEADKTKVSLAEITDAVSLINDMNQQIASATDEQKSTSREISIKVEKIAQACRKSNESAEQADAAGKTLKDVATELKEIISEFKMEA